MSDSRVEVLQRIREALKVHAHPTHAVENSSAVHPGEVREWLPRVGDTFEERAELFARNSTELRTEFSILENEEEVCATLNELARVNSWTEIGAHPGILTKQILSGIQVPIYWIEAGYSVDRLERCSAGITGCDALIAQTGSVLVTSRSAGGRALSVLPPHHVVLARKDQMLSDLSAAYELVRCGYAPHFPSMISVITGPSRTGDIERILVLGAHGPKRLSILLW